MLIKKNDLLIIAVSVFLTTLSGCGHNSSKESNSEGKERAVTDVTTEKKAEEATEKNLKEETKTESEQTEKAQEFKSTSTVKSSSQPEKKSEFKVTFIELGSVKCVPCKMMQPIMDEIEEEYPNQVKVLFYDVWTQEGQPYGSKYRIRAIPTQVFLDKDGNEYYRHVGYFPKEELLEILKMQGVE